MITECDRKPFDAAEVFVGKEDQRQTIEGQKEVVSYDCGENVSMLQMARNAEAALRTAGYTVVFSGIAEDAPVVTARKGNQWVQVHSYNPGGGTFGYRQTAVLVKAMEQEMVANADAWADEINRTGSCSIYGIHFATGKATIEPESRECLEEVVKLLNANPTWRMQIEGHTDNVGAKAAIRRCPKSALPRSWRGSPPTASPNRGSRRAASATACRLRTTRRKTAKRRTAV